jgi:hypothetical protein
MSNFKPSMPYNVPMYLLTPTTTTVKGVAVKTYPQATDKNLIFGSFKTYGGTESESNGVITVLDTANIETWFNPDIRPECRIMLAESNKVYEVIGEPEDIELRHQFLKFKVQAARGGA